MIVKTKKFALDKKKYVKIAFADQMKRSWKWLLIPLAVALLGMGLHFTGTYKNWWILITAIVGAILFVLFWYLQFYAATQMEQSAQLFQKFAYEIDSRQILLKMNKREGSIVKWDSIQRADKYEGGYILHVSRGQFFHFPESVFNSDHDRKLMESILTRKNLL